MKHSESINELALSLSVVQGQMPSICKDTAGYGYKYATLDGIISSVSPLLAKHGLSFMQHCEKGDLGSVSVTTMLMHSSGQWARSTIKMPVVQGKNASQATGTAVTYARRYALLAVLGIAPSDDSDGVVEGPKVVKAVEAAPKYLNSNEVDSIVNLAKEAGVDPSKILETYNVCNFTDIKNTEYERIMAKLKKRKEDV